MKHLTNLVIAAGVFIFKPLGSKIECVSVMYSISKGSKDTFKGAIYIEYPRRGIWTMAFISGESISQKGVPYYHVFVPTTLLGMVDSAIGGKTAVNHPKGKNLIGSFYQPKAVFIDPETLITLPSREFKAGMAEVIKYGVIKDKSLFEYLENEKNRDKILNLENESLIKIINKSIKTKACIVSEDEKENGIRAILNYGHSFGHVIENLCGYGEYLHGEAISIGMKIAGDIATEKNLWSKEHSLRQDHLIESYGLPTQTPKIKKNDVMKILMGDKKVRNGKMRFILPIELGEVDIFNDINETQFLKYFD